jgi:hypothetical protein
VAPHLNDPPEVAPHPNDPPHTPSTHAWISFVPAKFKRNKVKCSITVDTSSLMADQVYKRQLILQTNSEPETNDFTIEVQTAPLKSLKINYSAVVVSVLLISIFSLPVIIYAFAFIFEIFLQVALSSNRSSVWVVVYYIFLGLNRSILGVAVDYIFPILSAIFCFISGAKSGLNKGFIAVVFAIILELAIFIFIGIAFIFIGKITLYSLPGLSFLVNPIIIVASCHVVGNLFGFLVKEHKEVGFSQKSAFQISLVATVLGSSLLIGLQLGLGNPFAMLAFVIFEVVGAGLLLGIESRERKKLIDEYRQSEPHWIKP